MKCEEAEEKIYLYDELSATEKIIVDQHVASCDTCGIAMQAYTFQKGIISTLSINAPVPRNASALTHKIMDALEKQPRRISWIDRVQSYMDIVWLKISLTAVSAVLAVFFLVEQNQPQLVMGNGQTTEGPVLNTHLFMKQQKEATSEKRVSVYERYTQLKKERSEETL